MLPQHIALALQLLGTEAFWHGQAQVGGVRSCMEDIIYRWLGACSDNRNVDTLRGPVMEE